MRTHKRRRVSPQNIITTLVKIICREIIIKIHNPEAYRYPLNKFYYCRLGQNQLILQRIKNNGS